MEFLYGKMGLIILVSGETTLLKDKEDLLMPRVMCMMASGRKTKPVEKESFIQNQEKPIRDSGKMIFNMAEEKNSGQMGLNTKETI